MIVKVLCAKRIMKYIKTNATEMVHKVINPGTCKLPDNDIENWYLRYFEDSCP